MSANKHLFFDIDGTLLLTGGAGQVAMTETMIEMFGVYDLARLEVHGRTDFSIVTDLFDAHGIELTCEIRETFTESYHGRLPQAMNQPNGRLMPGVAGLLEVLATKAEQFRLGILTGNSKRASDIKLTHYGIHHYFEFGGYGQQYACRNEVAHEALRNCRTTYNDSVSPESVWVVGDTVHDITCARSIGANVVVVETGTGNCRDQLESYEPDAVLKDLSDVKAFLEAVA